MLGNEPLSHSCESQNSVQPINIPPALGLLEFITLNPPPHLVSNKPWPVQAAFYGLLFPVASGWIWPKRNTSRVRWHLWEHLLHHWPLVAPKSSGVQAPGPDPGLGKYFPPWSLQLSRGKIFLLLRTSGSLSKIPTGSWLFHYICNWFFD